MADVLIIDDDELVRETLKDILEFEGFNVSLAENGDEGLRQASEKKSAVVIVDMIMPNKGGVEIVRELHQINPETRILAISGGGRVGQLNFLEVAQKLGAFASLQKPIDPDLLLETVNSLFASMDA